MLLNYLKKRIKQKLGSFPENRADILIDASCNFACIKNIRWGRWISIGSNCYLEAKGGIEIGDGCILAPNVVILTSTHNYTCDDMIPYGGQDIFKPVTLGKAVWVGYGAMILPGVTLGDGVVVGAGAVVTKSFSAGNIVGGNPAVIINSRNGNHWKKLIADEQYRIFYKIQSKLNNQKTSADD